MYINKSKNLQSYKISEESSYAVKDKPAVVSAILMELNRSMHIVYLLQLNFNLWHFPPAAPA